MAKRPGEEVSFIKVISFLCYLIVGNASYHDPTAIKLYIKTSSDADDLLQEAAASTNLDKDA